MSHSCFSIIFPFQLKEMKLITLSWFVVFCKTHFIGMPYIMIYQHSRSSLMKRSMASSTQSDQCMEYKNVPIGHFWRYPDTPMLMIANIANFFIREHLFTLPMTDMPILEKSVDMPILQCRYKYRHIHDEICLFERGAYANNFADVVNLQVLPEQTFRVSVW